MKRIWLIAAVLVAAGPAMAAVDFMAVPEAGGAAIYYDATGESELVRAFALDITVDSGATITAITHYKEGVSVSGDKGYGIFPGSIDINEAGEVNDVGTPVADPCQLPSDTLGGLFTSGITIEMGSLYVGAPNAPDPCGLLCKVEFDSDCNMTVAVNVSRGEVVMEGGGQAITNLPIAVPICCTPPPCCAPDADNDLDIDLDDYYAMQGVLAYADYLKSGGMGSAFVVDGPTDPIAGHLWNECMDTDADDDIDLTDYYSCQGMLAYADYLKCGGQEACYSYFIIPDDPIAGHLWPCP